MKKYLFLPGGLLIVASLMWASFTLRWDTTPVVLGIGGLLALAVGVIANWQSVRDWFRDPRGVFVLNSIFTTLLVVAILGLVNAIVTFRAWQIDVTAAGRNTLTADTVKGLARLSQDVVLTQYGRTRAANVDELLAVFLEATPRLRATFTDVERAPQDARTFGLLRDGTVVVSSGSRWRKVEDPTESALFQAIMQVTQTREPLVCFATGEGEHGLDDRGARGYSGVAALLAFAGYKSERVSLLQRPVPASCEALIVGGPAAGLAPAAIDHVTAYLAAGGRLALLVDPPVDPATRAWLALRGVTVGDGFIIETSQAGRQVGAGPESPLALAYSDHPITRGFGLATIFDRAVPLTIQKKADIGLPGPVAGTGDGAFERIDLTVQGYEFREGRDRRGPFVLGMASTFARGMGEDQKVREGRMVVFGDSDFVANALLAKQGNRDLLLRTIAWLVGEEEARTVSLADRQNRRTALTEQMRTIMYVVNLGVLPLLPLLLGVIQFVRSRR